MGNVRVSFDKSPSTGLARLIQKDDYYPFGMTFSHPTVGENKYLYNGFEFQQDFGFELYDYMARFYDPALGRFINVDPAADLMRRFSPYSYAFDNPIRFIDPDGMMPEDVIIKGDLANKAVDQLNASSSLGITRDEETGRLSATGKANTKADKALLAAINDKNITVNLEATSSNTVEINGEKKDLLIGAFGGNAENADGTVSATAMVNPNQTEIAGEFYETNAGAYITHEILESYNAARDSPGAQPPSFNDIQNKTTNGKAYLNAHNKALKQDSKFVGPTFIGDNSSGAYLLQKMKSVPGVNIPLPFETTLYKKQ